MNIYYGVYPMLLISCTFSYPILYQTKDSIVLDYTNYHAFQPHGHGSYSFGYEIEDPEYHNIQYRDEERQPNGTVTGSYGWVKPDGNIIMVKYIADEGGYRVKVENSDGQLRLKSNEETRSTEMQNALNNLDLYKKQSLQEQHYRPIDLVYSNQLKKPNNYISNHLNNEEHKFNIEPNRIYLYNNV